MRALSQEELQQKKLQALTRLACQIFSRLPDGTPVFGTREVEQPTPGMLSSEGILLRRFLVKPLPEDWGEPPLPDPGDCDNCPACVKWPESANNRYLSEIRKEKAGKLFCCHGPYYAGSGAKKDRPKAITKRVRKACPLKNHKRQPMGSIA